MAAPQLQRPAQTALHGETLRHVEREFHDLIMSARALSALLRADPSRPPSEHVLVRMLESEMNQLGILAGELCTALRLEEQGPRIQPVNLAQALAQGAKRLRMHVAVDAGEPVVVNGDPEGVAQVVESALAMAVRLGDDGPATVAVRPSEDGGEVVVRVPAEVRSLAARRREARMTLLRKISAMQGGRVSVEPMESGSAIRVRFPAADAAPLSRRRVGV